SRKTKPASQEWMSRLLPYMPREELLGLWIAENEGAKCWANVLTELQNRGLKDIFIACVDGLKGFPEAINTVYPKTKIQLCIVHLVRNSLKFVSWK
ncbi:transposase, partial [Glaesserella parasuis]|uniref:transposase n=1 Tax=Glaesserella parasuis TaxID=738 RepID=UPI0039FCD12A